jgi:hypothetical protein
MRQPLVSIVLVLACACSGGGSDGPGPGGGPPPGGGCTTRAPLACWSTASTQYLLPVRAPIQLASCSYSYEGEALSYAWAIQSRPAASTSATLSTGAATATLVADAVGDYLVALTVTDSCGSTTSSHTISPIEFAPLANAGDDRFVAFGSPAPEFALDGTRTSDANQDPLTWAWSITAAPPGSAAALVGADTATPRLTPDVPGSYTVTLVVSDGRSTDEDAVVVGAYHPVVTAPVDPWKVEYSAALDRIVAVEYQGTSLWIVNPHDGSTAEVPISSPGEAPLYASTWALALSPDGLHAAVSRVGKVAYVDLSAGTVVRQLTTTQDGGAVVLTGNGVAYAFPRDNISGGVQIVPLDGTAERNGPTASAGLSPRANAAGTRVYAFRNSSIVAWSIAAGGTDMSWITAVPESTIRAKGDGPWLSPDGARIYSGSGDVYTWSMSGYSIAYTRMTDSLLLAADAYHSLDWIADSEVAGRILVVPFSYGGPFRVVDRGTFAILEEHAAPARIAGGVSVGWPRYAFWKADASGFYVVTEMSGGGMGIAEY